jgi:hypothetical protein
LIDFLYRRAAEDLAAAKSLTTPDAEAPPSVGIEQKTLAGSFTLLGKSMMLNRMGYDAMQLAGPDVLGPPC